MNQKTHLFLHYDVNVYLNRVCCVLSPGMEPMSEPEAVLQPSTEKLSFIDRLVNTITKRKRSTPQKFLGEFSPVYICPCS